MPTQKEVYCWLNGQRPFQPSDIVTPLMKEFTITRRKAKQFLNSWMSRIL